MDTTSQSRRPPKSCATCGEGVFVLSDAKGLTFAYRDELDLELHESLMLQICNVCSESRLNAANTVALNEALARAYAALHREAATDAVTRLTNVGWRQVEIEQVMALSSGYLSKALRGEKALSGSTLRHLIHVSRHPRRALNDLAPLYPNIKTLKDSLRRRGVLTGE